MVFKSINESISKGGAQVKNNVPNIIDSVKGSITSFFSTQNVYSNSDTEKLMAYMSKFSELKEKINKAKSKNINLNIKDDIIAAKAFKETMTDASEEAQNFAKENNVATMALDNLKNHPKPLN